MAMTVIDPADRKTLLEIIWRRAGRWTSLAFAALLDQFERGQIPSLTNEERDDLDYTGDSRAYSIHNSTSGKLNTWDGEQWVEADGTPT